MSSVKKQRAVMALLLSMLLFLTACGAGPQPKEEPEGEVKPGEPLAPALIECSYSVMGDEWGGYTFLSLQREENAVMLSFAAAASANGSELAVDAAVDPALLEEVRALAESGNMCTWQDLPPDELMAEDDAVSTLRLTWEDGTKLYVSSRDALPKDGDRAFNGIIRLLYTAQTPDGQPVFEGENALVDLSALAEPEPEPGGRDWELTAAREQLNGLRQVLTDEGAEYALALLGYPDVMGGPVEADRGYLALMLDAEGYEDYAFLAELPSDCFVETEAGTELYLLLIRDPSASVQVFEWQLEEGETACGKRGRLMFEGSGELPLLLRCNVSDVIPEMEVAVTLQEGEEIVFWPCLSLEDGRIAMDEKGKDISNYIYAVG